MVLASSVLVPIATFCSPVVFANKALSPTAVLFDASVFDTKAFLPIATFSAPVVFAFKAALPTAVLFAAVVFG